MRAVSLLFLSAFLSMTIWLDTAHAAQWPLVPQDAEHSIIRDYGQHYLKPDDWSHSIHRALDFDVPLGTDVLSAANGILAFIPTAADAPSPYYQRRVFSTDGDHAWEY